MRKLDQSANPVCYPRLVMEENIAYELLQAGLVLLEEGHPAQAALVLEKARRHEPHKGSILEVLGRAYYEFGRYRDAALSFEEALDVDPTNDYAHYCLGLCCLKLEKKAEAGGHFKVAWFLKPRDMYRQKVERYGIVTGSPELDRESG